MHWLIDPIRYHYADFSGRTSRKEFWMFQLMMLLIVVVFFTLLTVFGIGLASSGTENSSGTLFFALWFIPIALFMLAIIVPSIAIAVRRLHDIGRSGWWYLISFVPWVGGIIIIVLECLPSQKGTNKWGANPYGIESDVQTPVVAPATASTMSETESAVVGYGNEIDTKN